MLKKSQLFKIDRNIGFAHVIPDTPVIDESSLTTYDLHFLAQTSPPPHPRPPSSLTYQLPLIDIHFSILSNLDNLPDLYNNAMEQEFPESLPVTNLDWDYNVLIGC